MIENQDPLDSFQSATLQTIGRYLLECGHSITFYGKAWSNSKSNWIYFDTSLNLEHLIQTYDNEKQLQIHENRDPRSGREKGLIDSVTGEAIVGYLE